MEAFILTRQFGRRGSWPPGLRGELLQDCTCCTSASLAGFLLQEMQPIPLVPPFFLPPPRCLQPQPRKGFLHGGCSEDAQGNGRQAMGGGGRDCHCLPKLQPLSSPLPAWKMLPACTCQELLQMPSEKPSKELNKTFIPEETSTVNCYLGECTVWQAEQQVHTRAALQADEVRKQV